MSVGYSHGLHEAPLYASMRIPLQVAAIHRATLFVITYKGHPQYMVDRNDECASQFKGAIAVSRQLTALFSHESAVMEFYARVLAPKLH